LIFKISTALTTLSSQSAFTAKLDGFRSYKHRQQCSTWLSATKSTFLN